MTFLEYCHEVPRLDLLAQWHPEKNGDLRPQDFSYGSKAKIWWRCEKGHEWVTSAYNRTAGGNGCPYCAGKRPWKGENDLGTLYPHLAAQWHPEKNRELKPTDVTPGSRRMVWWRCEHGHEWQCRVKSRTEGTGCPVCQNRRVEAHVNDLATSHPDLAAQWHPEKNGGLRPENFVAGSGRKIWWRCGKGHEWQASIMSRTGKSRLGCPVCSGKAVAAGENDLATIYPELAAQWHPEKNELLTPCEVTAYSNRRVWWLCERGHEWQATIASRSSGKYGCPVCVGRRVQVGFNDLATIQPKVASQWAADMNGTLTPQMVTAGSSKKVWWRCAEGHVWKAIISSRTGKRKHGCPVCAGNVKKIRYTIDK